VGHRARKNGSAGECTRRAPGAGKSRALLRWRRIRGRRGEKVVLASTSTSAGKQVPLAALLAWKHIPPASLLPAWQDPPATLLPAGLLPPRRARPRGSCSSSPVSSSSSPEAPPRRSPPKVCMSSSPAPLFPSPTLSVCKHIQPVSSVSFPYSCCFSLISSPLFLKSEIVE